MNEEIKKWYRIKDNIGHYIYYLRIELATILHHIELETLEEQVRDYISVVIHKKYQTQKKKIDKLIQIKKEKEKQSIQTNNEKPVFYPRFKNYSNTLFDKNEEELLEKGFKYSPNTNIKQSHVRNLAMDVEIATKEQKHKYQLANEIQKYNKIKQNCNKSENQAIKTIQQKIKRDNLTVTKADKGNCLVILNKKDYVKKVEEFLTNKEFTKITKDPTTKYQKEVKEMINKYKSIFSDGDQRRLVNQNPQPPRMYGQPKLHKENIPIRPVVSYNSSPTYKIEKKLSQIFKEKTKFQAKYSLKNTQDLVNKIKDIEIPENAKLVSFDVVNLFTNIPVLKLKIKIKEILESKNLNQTEISEIYDVLEKCINNNYFQFNQKLYIQNQGLPMGSPLSPLFAEIFMDSLEDQILNNNNNFGQQNILYWYRYVDDVICLWKGTNRQLQKFHKHINSLDPNIQFTIETEENNSINFLDLTITKINKKHDFSIYRKPTHTDTIIHNNSRHSYGHKVAAFNSMIHRLINIPMNQENYQKELTTIEEIATNNGYTKELIQRRLRNIKKNKALAKIYTKTKETNMKWNKISYIGPISNKITRIMNKNGQKTAHYNNHKLSHFFRNDKDKIEKMNTTGVYELSCGTCEKTYIGRTYRNFNTRIKEHIAAYRNRHMDKSNFADHLLTSNHIYDDNIKILHQETDKRKIDILEEIEILKNQNKIVNTQINITTSPLTLMFATPVYT